MSGQSRHLATGVTGLILAFTQVALAQVGQPPAPVPAPAAQPDLNNLVHQMAERVRHLGEDIASDLAQSPQGRHLIEDTRELADAVDEFHETLHNIRDLNQLRQAYRGIDESWHHLKSQLVRPGIASPAVDRAARRVDERDAQIHRALALGAIGPQAPPPVPPPGVVPAPGLIAPVPGPDPGDAPPPPPSAALVPVPSEVAPTGPGPAVPWTGPRGVAGAARGLAEAAAHLRDSVREVSEDSPLVTELDRLARSAAHFGDAVRNGAPLEHARRDFQKIQVGFERTLAALKRDHDVHHDEHAAGDAKALTAAFDRLLAQMSGRRG
jgi:hypothetical protein